MNIPASTVVHWVLEGIVVVKKSFQTSQEFYVNEMVPLGWLQSLKSQEDEELQTHLQIFSEHQEEDFEEFSHRYDNVRAEFEYPFRTNFLYSYKIYLLYEVFVGAGIVHKFLVYKYL